MPIYNGILDDDAIHDERSTMCGRITPESAPEDG